MATLSRKEKKMKRIREMDGAYSGSLGVELVSNGSFESVDDWTFGNGWILDVINDAAETDGTSVGILLQAITGGLEDGGLYLVSFVLKGVNDLTKNFTITLGGNIYVIGAQNGLHQSAIKAGALDDAIQFTVNTLDAYVGLVDSVSLRKIG